MGSIEEIHKKLTKTMGYDLIPEYDMKKSSQVPILKLDSFGIAGRIYTCLSVDHDSDSFTVRKYPLELRISTLKRDPKKKTR